MAIVFVKGGQCGKETVITARKNTPTTVSLSFETSCKHIAKLAEELEEVNAGSEMTLPMRDTAVYHATSEHCCRNSCIVPAATLKGGGGREPLPARGRLRQLPGGRPVKWQHVIVFGFAPATSTIRATCALRIPGESETSRMGPVEAHRAPGGMGR